MSIKINFADSVHNVTKKKNGKTQNVHPFKFTGGKFQVISFLFLMIWTK